ncbi:response regulator [Desulfovibrio sp. OttesenSCG-928-O18]|nr:response regulator [Desulfovibrio sp. OttesenSCG-928-O18]
MKLVLVVDDNLTNLRHISALLANTYRVLLAKSGKQALLIAAEQIPDIIMLDVEMPEMDGFATLAALRNNPALARVPVLFFTAGDNVATQVRALEAGAVDFVRKPYEKGILLHRLDLHLKLVQYQQDQERTIKELEDSIVNSFAELIECRDANNGGHVQRTRGYVAALGELLVEANLFTDELDPETLEMIVRASPLHDIGKIGISDLIMFKPGKLTEEEYEIVKTHTTIGARTLAHIHERTPTQKYLLHAQLMAEGHHERYDGTGYPKGLRGEAIPLCCRLMAVANVYDALVSNTAYRAGMSHEDACAILQQGKGREFDPHIINVFIENNEIFARIAGKR